MRLALHNHTENKEIRAENCGKPNLILSLPVFPKVQYEWVTSSGGHKWVMDLFHLDPLLIMVCFYEYIFHLPFLAAKVPQLIPVSKRTWESPPPTPITALTYNTNSNNGKKELYSEETSVLKDWAFHPWADERLSTLSLPQKKKKRTASENKLNCAI